MIDATTLTADIERLEMLLADKLGARRGNLARRAAKAGRRLPKWVRRNLEFLSQCGHIAGHPQLASTVEPAMIARAVERSERHLNAIDVKERRIKTALGIAAGLIVQLVILFAVAVAVMRWRGLI